MVNYLFKFNGEDIVIKKSKGKKIHNVMNK